MIDESDLALTLGQSIEKTAYTKFLGLVLDEHLTWSTHIDLLCRRISKSIGVLYRARHLLNLDIMKKLYYNIMYSHISYGTLIWGSNYETKIRPIHILQKRALRIISFSDSRAPSRPLFQKFKMLNIFEIVKLQLAEIAYKCVNKQLPFSSSSYFKDVNLSHEYNTRSKKNKNIFVPRKNLNYGQFGVDYKAARTWNEIPFEIKNSSSITSFRKKFKHYLISS